MRRSRPGVGGTSLEARGASGPRSGLGCVSVWHRTVGGHAQVGAAWQVVPIGGSAQSLAGATLAVTNLPDVSNAVVAVRPDVDDRELSSPARGHRVAFAFEHRTSAGTEIRFSELGLSGGSAAAVRDVLVTTTASTDSTSPRLVWAGRWYALGWLQHDASAIGSSLRVAFLRADGTAIPTVAGHRDAGLPAELEAVSQRISPAGQEVLSFDLAWSGRHLHVAWTDRDAGGIRHRWCALALPDEHGRGGFWHPFDRPSAALVRATLVNGATNLADRALPAFDGSSADSSYGWGRLKFCAIERTLSGLCVFIPLA